MANEAFYRYAPFIQNYIYAHDWQDLRKVQADACDLILDIDKNILIASQTASGKTEAAFFPILTKLEEEPSKSASILYIGPLKALINDQFQRLDELLEEQDIPVWPWHGDVSSSKKQKALQEARGIVQITPESLEALLMRRPGEARFMFSDLKYIIIDEIHAFMGTDRGAQLLCLISRLERLIGKSPRRIGLSATLHDYKPAMEWLGMGSQRGCALAGIETVKRKIGIGIRSYELSPDEIEAQQDRRKMFEFLYDSVRKSKCLIFTNSRASCEEVIAVLKTIARQRHEPDIFFAHHGSISASSRKAIETRLKDSSQPTVVAATTTLELGIDIGDLDFTVQYEAPFTCSSFVQRLGRSGRRTGVSRMLFINEHQPTADIIENLPWDLLRSIAVTELYIKDSFVEPFVMKPKPFSLAAHQTLSVLMQKNELTPAQLAREILTLPPFLNQISQDEYRQLLRYMIDNDYIERMETGTLIPGLKGERIANHYHFYAVFQPEEEWHVFYKEEIGTVSSRMMENEVLTLGGKYWKVISLDEDRKKIYVEPAQRPRIKPWGGGSVQIHDRIVEKMRDILDGTEDYKYLDPTAKNLLQEARDTCQKYNLTKQTFFQLDRYSYLILPWKGTRIVETMYRMLMQGFEKDLEIISAYQGKYWLYFRTRLELPDFLEKLNSLNINASDPSLVLPEDRSFPIDCYDSMVPPDLLRQSFLANHMDVPDAMEAFKKIAALPADSIIRLEEEEEDDDFDGEDLVL